MRGWSEIRPLVDDDADDLSSQFGHFTNCLSINDKKQAYFLAEEVLLAEGRWGIGVQIGP